VTTGGPIPLDRVAGLNSNGGGHEYATTRWSDLHYCRRGVSDMEKEDERKSQEAAEHPALGRYFHNGGIFLPSPATNPVFNRTAEETRTFWLS
jgi:hypothetical protein